MADNRLRDEEWRARVGFDNIDEKPWRPVRYPRLPPPVPITQWFDAHNPPVADRVVRKGR